jgi:hypothetical protein
MTPKERSQAASKAALARWERLTPDERSAEMKRRARKRRNKRALLRAVARAYCWFDDLVRGRSMVEIARRNRVGKQYVSRLVRLAFLAPEVVELIVAGRQPP